MYHRIINFTLLAPSLWTMINQFNVKDNKNIIIIKIADNKGVIIESYENSSLAGKQTAILVAMQSLKAQAMAKVLVEEGLEVQFLIFKKLKNIDSYKVKVEEGDLEVLIIPRHRSDTGIYTKKANHSVSYLFDFIKMHYGFSGLFESTYKPFIYSKDSVFSNLSYPELRLERFIDGFSRDFVSKTINKILMI